MRARHAPAVAVAGLLLFPPSAAQAAERGAVVSTDPADGAALATAPDRVRLTGSSTPDPARSHVVVRDAGGRTVETTAAPRVSGNELSQPVRLTGRGDFTMVFHIEFTDGQEAVGEVRFSVDTGVAPAAAPPAQARADAAAAHSHGVDPLSAILLLADAAVVVVVALLLALRPARHQRRDAEARHQRHEERDANVAAGVREAPRA